MKKFNSYTPPVAAPSWTPIDHANPTTHVKAKKVTKPKEILELVPNQVSKIKCSAAQLAQLLPSLIIPQICSHRRGHNSYGEYVFLKEFLIPKFEALNVAYTSDGFGNIYVQVGQKFTPVLHVGHLDTVHGEDTIARQSVSVDAAGLLSLSTEKYAKNAYTAAMSGPKSTEVIVKLLNKKGRALRAKPQEAIPKCLGADDGVAIATMLYLIANKVPGMYLFTRGEEVGCLGSKYVIENFPEFLARFDMALQVDRKGKEEIIIEQSTGKCASKVFGEALAISLGMGHEISFKGVITDTGKMNKLIPECVNLAAGYYNQHHTNETSCMIYADELAAAMVKLNWALLPITRKPSDTVSEKPTPPPVQYTPPSYTPHGYNPNAYNHSRGRGNGSVSVSGNVAGNGIHNQGYWDDFEQDMYDRGHRGHQQSERVGKPATPQTMSGSGLPHTPHKPITSPVTVPVKRWAFSGVEEILDFAEEWLIKQGLYNNLNENELTLAMACLVTQLQDKANGINTHVPLSLPSDFNRPKVEAPKVEAPKSNVTQIKPTSDAPVKAGDTSEGFLGLSAGQEPVVWGKPASELSDIELEDDLTPASLDELFDDQEEEPPTGPIELKADGTPILTVDNWSHFYSFYYDAFPNAAFGLPVNSDFIEFDPQVETFEWVLENAQLVAEYLMFKGVSKAGIDRVSILFNDPLYTPNMNNTGAR